MSLNGVSSLQSSCPVVLTCTSSLGWLQTSNAEQSLFIALSILKSSRPVSHFLLFLLVQSLSAHPSYDFAAMLSTTFTWTVFGDQVWPLRAWCHAVWLGVVELPVRERALQLAQNVFLSKSGNNWHNNTAK